MMPRGVSTNESRLLAYFRAPHRSAGEHDFNAWHPVQYPADEVKGTPPRQVEPPIKRDGSDEQAQQWMARTWSSCPMVDEREKVWHSFAARQQDSCGCRDVVADRAFHRVYGDGGLSGEVGDPVTPAGVAGYMERPRSVPHIRGLGRSDSPAPPPFAREADEERRRQNIPKIAR